MKIILTGHTSPIGRVIENEFKNYDLQKLHYSAGWDLSKADVCKQIADLEGDVFINCAHVGICQATLLEHSHSPVNISFSSYLTKFNWTEMKRYASVEYLMEKLLLEHIHSFKSQSALIRISSYGEGPVPSVTDEQITSCIYDIIQGKVSLPNTFDIDNGLGKLSDLADQKC